MSLSTENKQMVIMMLHSELERIFEEHLIIGHEKITLLTAEYEKILLTHE